MQRFEDYGRVLDHRRETVARCQPQSPPRSSRWQNGAHPSRHRSVSAVGVLGPRAAGGHVKRISAAEALRGNLPDGVYQYTGSAGQTVTRWLDHSRPRRRGGEVNWLLSVAARRSWSGPARRSGRALVMT
jgi:hypothetical protein